MSPYITKQLIPVIVSRTSLWKVFPKSVFVLFLKVQCKIASSSRKFLVALIMVFPRIQNLTELSFQSTLTPFQFVTWRSLLKTSQGCTVQSLRCRRTNLPISRNRIINWRDLRLPSPPQLPRGPCITPLFNWTS